MLRGTGVGVTEEHDVAHAFLEAMPFVSLLVVFFAVVAIIKEQVRIWLYLYHWASSYDAFEDNP